MNAVSARPRHDRADLRRLAEFGYEPVRWRRPPAGVTQRGVIVLSEPAPAKGLLADLLRGLGLTGRPLQVVAPTTVPIEAKALVVRFRSTPASVSGDIVLPDLAELRGNPAAKREAWAALRAALR